MIEKHGKVKIFYIVFLIILFGELVVSIGSFLFSESEIIRDAGLTNIFLIVLTTAAVLLPWIIEQKYKIDIPDSLEIVLLVMLFIAVVLGFLNDYYVNVKGFDKITHTLSGITISLISFQLLLWISKSKKYDIRIGPVFTSMFTFTFSMTLLVVWEFYEFTVDTISYILDETTLRNMQRYQWVNDTINFPQDYGLYDTMIDLWVGALGALIVSVVGYFLMKKEIL